MTKTYSLRSVSLQPYGTKLCINLHIRNQESMGMKFLQYHCDDFPTQAELLKYAAEQTNVTPDQIEWPPHVSLQSLSNTLKSIDDETREKQQKKGTKDAKVAPQPASRAPAGSAGGRGPVTDEKQKTEFTAETAIAGEM